MKNISNSRNIDTSSIINYDSNITINHNNLSDINNKTIDNLNNDVDRSTIINNNDNNKIVYSSKKVNKPRNYSAYLCKNNLYSKELDFYDNKNSFALNHPTSNDKSLLLKKEENSNLILSNKIKSDYVSRYKEDKLNISKYQFSKAMFQFEKSKLMLDPIYGSIFIPNYCFDFIDKPEYQRLRNLKQLGNAYQIFPGGVHTRFEHCIGTAYLCTLAMDYLTPSLLYEQDMDFRDVKFYKEVVTNAGLLHDLGHGPFSHLYDKCLHQFAEAKGLFSNDINERSVNCFLSNKEDVLNITNNYNNNKKILELIEHEERSACLIDYIIDKYYIDNPVLNDKSKIHLIKNLILGGELNKNTSSELNWLYQIVANKTNSIDVDKIDYLRRDTYMIGQKCGSIDFDRLFSGVRVINNDLCYNIKNDSDILKLFQSRFRQYKQIYYHKNTVAYDLMVKEAFILSDSYYNYLDLTANLETYCSLDDNIIHAIYSVGTEIEYMTMNNNNYTNNFAVSNDNNILDDEVNINDLIKAKSIIQRIYNREPYYFVCERIIPNNSENDFMHKIRSIDICIDDLKEDDIIIHYHSLDYGNKDKNPFDLIQFYKETDDVSKSKFQIPSWKCALTVPGIFKVKYIRVYCKEKKHIELAQKGTNLYFNKNFGYASDKVLNNSSQSVEKEENLLNKKRDYK